METTCNLQCWCHVPIRGRNKPPCYLCVLQDCSLSRKTEICPTAPPLSPEPQEERVPSFPEPHEVLAASFPETPEGLAPTFPEPQEVLAPLFTATVPADCEAGPAVCGDTSYGWRVTLTTQASGISHAGLEDLKQESQVYVPMQTEDTEDSGSCATNYTAPQDHPSHIHFSSDTETEKRCSLKHSSREHFKVLRKHRPPKLRIQKYKDLTPNEGIKDENNITNKTELSELLKSLVLGTNDNLLQDAATNLPDSDDSWLNQNQTTLRRTPWTYEASLGHENTLSGRNRFLAASDDMINIRSSRPSKYFSSTTERNYKSINRINRRESFAEAARRHQQNTLSQKRSLTWTQSGML